MELHREHGTYLFLDELEIILKDDVILIYN